MNSVCPMPIALRIRLPNISRLLIFGCLLVLTASAVAGQSSPTVAKQDTSALLKAFKHGKVQGQFRSFFMATDNAAGLKDDHALALGGVLRYETGAFHGFSIATAGSFSMRLLSSDLDQPDSVTAQPNRYEIGLFDVTAPGNYHDLYRLEELHLHWEHPKLSVRLGRQLPNGPFINLQDGRMRPTAVEGLWSEWRPSKRLRIEGGWLWGISPRSTWHWYRVGPSIGLYPRGVSVTGTPSGYRDSLQSKGVFALGIHASPHKSLKLLAWNQFVENIFNTALLQADWTQPLGEKVQLTVAGQAIRQDVVGSGGHDNPQRAYALPGSHAMTYGGRLGLKVAAWDLQVNYNRITAAGRYLMPREWGRDPFFTFLPRERTEGFGDVHAAVLKAERNFKKVGLRTGLGLGYIDLPEANDFPLDKYGMTDYVQVNAEVKYAVPGLLKGLEVQLLAVGKLNQGDLQANRRFEYNKVHMVNWNGVVQYSF